MRGERRGNPEKDSQRLLSGLSFGGKFSAAMTSSRPSGTRNDKLLNI
jgi:hypothetical protein